MAEKLRLDAAVYQRGLAPSREKARRMIMAGEVRVNGQIADKPGMRIKSDANITVTAKPRFVSRGGEKLAGALAAFPVNIEGAICADVGASTGGFTDCLLQHGAAKVYAIDVGYGQLDYKLRQDSRVVVMERTNARYVEKLDDAIDIVVMDASFISLRLLLPVVKGWLAKTATVIPLIKPQFEAGKRDVGKGGVVRDSEVHQRVLFDVLHFAREADFGVQGLVRSPLKGPAGNIEFLAWLTWPKNNEQVDIEQLIAEVLD